MKRGKIYSKVNHLGGTGPFVCVQAQGSLVEPGLTKTSLEAACALCWPIQWSHFAETKQQGVWSETKWLQPRDTVSKWNSPVISTMQPTKLPHLPIILRMPCPHVSNISDKHRDSRGRSQEISTMQMDLSSSISGSSPQEALAKLHNLCGLHVQRLCCGHLGNRAWCICLAYYMCKAISHQRRTSTTRMFPQGPVVLVSWGKRPSDGSGGSLRLACFLWNWLFGT